MKSSRFPNRKELLRKKAAGMCIEPPQVFAESRVVSGCSGYRQRLARCCKLADYWSHTGKEV